MSGVRVSSGTQVLIRHLRSFSFFQKWLGIQAVKRDYSLLMGESIIYPRVIACKPLDVKKSVPAINSAKIQGLQAEKDGLED